MKYYKQIMALGVGLLSLPLCSCDGETKTVEREVVVSGDQNLNLVGKVFGEGGDFKFEFISETRVKISEPFDPEVSPTLAGEYDYTVDKNEVLINLKSTFRNQSAVEVASLFNNEITNNPAGNLAVAYQDLLEDDLARRPLDQSYEKFYNEALAFFISNGAQVSLDTPTDGTITVSGDLSGLLDIEIIEEVGLIIGQNSQFVRFRVASLNFTAEGTEAGSSSDITVNAESNVIGF